MPDLSDKVNDHKPISNEGLASIAKGEFLVEDQGLVSELAAELLAYRTRPTASSMEGWRTMDSAPKNLKVLVAYRNQLGKWRIVTACYHTQLPWSDDEEGIHDEEYAPEGWYEESDSNETIYRTSSAPEFWQPLPAAPIPPEVMK